MVVAGVTGFADDRPAAGIGLAAGRSGNGTSYIFGGPGRSGSTAAVRAYRDLLNHGSNAKILTVAHRGQWRYAGDEWLTYDVDVPRSGTYALSARVSSPYTPAGTYTVSFDGGAESERVEVRNTTSHNKEVLQASGVRQFLTAGHHVLRISLPQDAYQNWNLDYLQLEPVRR